MYHNSPKPYSNYEQMSLGVYLGFALDCTVPVALGNIHAPMDFSLPQKYTRHVDFNRVYL